MQKVFENYKVFEYNYAGRPLKVEIGKVAGLANGSCMISYGETVVLACATASAKPRDGIDFLPLSVDYDEKLYAVGSKIFLSHNFISFKYLLYVRNVLNKFFGRCFRTVPIAVIFLK